MRGSEKQIKWAQEIIERIVPVLEQTAKDIAEFPIDDEAKAASISAYNERIEALRNAEYAGDVINLFKDVRLTGEHEEDFKRVAAVYRVSIPYSDEQEKILGKPRRGQNYGESC